MTNVQCAVGRWEKNVDRSRGGGENNLGPGNFWRELSPDKGQGCAAIVEANWPSGEKPMATCEEYR